MYESLKALDKVHLNFNSESQFFLNFAIAVIMFGVALELNPEHFTRLFKHPKPAIIGVVSQFVMRIPEIRTSQNASEKSEIFFI